MAPVDLVVQQIVALAWIRCVQEEGVDFVNKYTGAIETDEILIYDSLQKQEGLFDVPAAKGSKWGLEKNMLEVIGGYLLYSEDPQILTVMTSQTFKQHVKNKIEEIRQR